MYKVILYQGCEDLEVIGKSKDVIHNSVNRKYTPFQKGDSYVEDYDEYHINYDHDFRCECIELFDYRKITYKDQELLSIKRKKLIDLFKKLHPGTTVYSDEMGVAFPELSLGFTFDYSNKTNYVLIGKKGYYDFLLN